MVNQEQVAAFIEAEGMEAPPAYRLLDLISEVGEVAKDAAESTDYGSAPAEIEVKSDEIGDVLFALLAFSEALDINAGAALDEALGKYDDRISDAGDPSSGN
jgi:NTP pyrophosphatase (non-canonical NTP hydrolase)